MAAEKKPFLELPLKVVLTEEGASHFISRKKRLLRFRLADNVEEYGISLSTFAPLSLQSMILVDYVSKIEISMPEFVTSRQEIMDLSKLVVYSVLYKQFDREILSALLATDCIRKHNWTDGTSPPLSQIRVQLHPQASQSLRTYRNILCDS